MELARLALRLSKTQPAEDISDNSVLILGGARGIGAGIGNVLSKSHVQVAVMDPYLGEHPIYKTLPTLEDNEHVVTFVGDSSKQDEVQAALKYFKEKGFSKFDLVIDSSVPILIYELGAQPTPEQRDEFERFYTQRSYNVIQAVLSEYPNIKPSDLTWITQNGARQESISLARIADKSDAVARMRDGAIPTDFYASKNFLASKAAEAVQNHLGINALVIMHQHMYDSGLTHQQFTPGFHPGTHHPPSITYDPTLLGFMPPSFMGEAIELLIRFGTSNFRNLIVSDLMLHDVTMKEGPTYTEYLNGDKPIINFAEYSTLTLFETIMRLFKE
jgi:hypothetical protein